MISAAAKGAQRLKSKLFAATGLFCYSEFLLFPSKNLYIVDEATPIEVFFELRSSVEGMSLAVYLAELMGTLAPEGEEALVQLRLLLNSLALSRLIHHSNPSFRSSRSHQLQKRKSFPVILDKSIFHSFDFYPSKLQKFSTQIIYF